MNKKIAITAVSLIFGYNCVKFNHINPSHEHYAPKNSNCSSMPHTDFNDQLASGSAHTFVESQYSLSYVDHPDKYYHIIKVTNLY